MLLASLVCAGCNATTDDAVAPDGVSSSDTTPAAITDQWLGQWNGPEGTWLRLDGGNGVYEITLKNLDGALTVPGRTAGNRIEFERNGLKETIHATNGAATGMKWLDGKADCLTIKPGEGYCRD